jgi:hypothetical protein
MTERKNAGKPGDLHEIIADIAYTAGIARHYSGDSRADIHAYISWAQEFASTFTQEQEDAGEYMERIEVFANAKLADAGNCDTPTAPHPGAARYDEARAECKRLMQAYGLQWTAKVPRSAYESMELCNLVLTEKDRREIWTEVMQGR